MTDDVGKLADLAGCQRAVVEAQIPFERIPTVLRLGWPTTGGE